MSINDESDARIEAQIVKRIDRVGGRMTHAQDSGMLELLLTPAGVASLRAALERAELVGEEYACQRSVYIRVTK